jgi:hypothetical protein
MRPLVRHESELDAELLEVCKNLGDPKLTYRDRSKSP